FRLSRLVIFTAEDRVVRFATAVDSEVLIRVICIPKGSDRDTSPRDGGADDIGRIKRQLRLEKRSADETGFSEQRIVCGQNDSVVIDPVPVDPGALFFRIEFLRCGVFKDM